MQKHQIVKCGKAWLSNQPWTTQLVEQLNCIGTESNSQLRYMYFHNYNFYRGIFYTCTCKTIYLKTFHEVDKHWC